MLSTILGAAVSTIFTYVTVLDNVANQAENAPSAPPSSLNSTSTINSTNLESTDDSGVFNLSWYWYTILVAGLIVGLLPISNQLYLFFKCVIPRSSIHKRIETQGYFQGRTTSFSTTKNVKAFVKKEFELRLDFLSCEIYTSESGKEYTSRLCIFVDDLDRCSGDTVMETLDAIILLLADAPVLCWLALDSRLVEASIEEQNNVLEVAGVTSGYDYMEKMIQLPFFIPDLDNPRKRNFYPGCFSMGN